MPVVPPISGGVPVSYARFPEIDRPLDDEAYYSTLLSTAITVRRNFVFEVEPSIGTSAAHAEHCPPLFGTRGKAEHRVLSVPPQCLPPVVHRPEEFVNKIG